ncbi:hypothetical protein ACOSP7_021907 [Xanthoceras sorbifolium]
MYCSYQDYGYDMISIYTIICFFSSHETQHEINEVFGSIFIPGLNMFINDLLKKHIKHLGKPSYAFSVPEDQAKQFEECSQLKLKVANNSIVSSVTALNPLSSNSFSIYFFPNSILQVISALRAPTLALRSTAIPKRAASFTYSIKRSSSSFLIDLKELILTLLSSSRVWSHDHVLFVIGNVPGRFKSWPASKSKVLGSQEQLGRL